MLKHKLKRLLALALSILLLSSDLSGLIPSAHAAEATAGGVTSGEQLDFRDKSNGRPNLFVDFLGDNHHYKTSATTDAGITLGGLPIPAGYDQSTSSNPSGPGNNWPQYKSSDIDPTTANKTIFWVGVGIDRKEVFKLLESGEGLTSFEGGFYYDNEVIEPYYDSNYLPAGADPANPTEEEVRAAYYETITRANITTYNNYPENTQWNGNYTILRAETGLKPATDLITQEEISSPSIDQILNNTNDGMTRDWRMTYVSLELEDIEATPAAQRRLGGSVYTGPTTDKDGNVITPPSASGNGSKADPTNPNPNDPNSDYQYLLLIPFRLKKYGGEDRLHLRLLRNATHFSIGAGKYGASTYGETEDDTYAAWERVTTRNPDRDLKLLTNFTGDLYLFNPEPPKANDEEYTALLKIINGGSTENTARLEVDGDPAVWPVWADADGEEIEQLYSGLGMKLKVHAQIGYTATVVVTYPAADGTIVTHPFTSDVARTTNPDGSHSYPNQQDSNHNFVIPVFGPPPRVITVTVTFQHTDGDDFRVFLSEIPQPGDAGYRTGNETTITTNLDENYDPTPDTNTINSFDPAVAHPNSSHAGLTHADGPMGMATKDKGVRVHVETHADYEVLVRTYNFLQQGYTIPDVKISAVGGAYQTDNRLTVDDGHGNLIANPDYGILLPMGGDITFVMGASDIDVEVIYRKAARHKATLEVYHQTTTPATPVKDTNVAQLGYLAYDDENVSSMVYSGVVYEDDTKTPSDHRAVKASPSRKLPWVSSSAATLSGSLGGDTNRVGKVWHPGDLTTPLDPETGSSTVMALLAAAPDRATFRTQINGLDLSTTVLKDSGGTAIFTGFRKNLYGDLYSDADAADFADLLWELRERIDSDTSAGGLKDTYHKSVPKSATDSTVAYEYYDLTAAQVQDYLLSIFKSEEKDNANASGYREVRRAYLAAKQVYDELMTKASYQTDLKPIYAPNAPREVEVNADGVRKYEDPDYKTLYIHSYDLYITAYQKYVDAAKQYGSATAAEVLQLWADENLATHEHNIQNTFTQEAVPIHTAADAATNVATQNNAWKTSVIKPDNTPDAADDPATPAHTIYTRDGRTVWVVLEADSAYQEVRVELHERNEDGSTGAVIASDIAQADGYRNVYSFTMPEQDCVVRVTYGLRKTHKLNITYKGVDGMKDNVSVVEAYQIADPAAVKPELASRTNAGHLTTDPYSPDPIEAVFEGSTVTIHVKVDEDYEVELMAVDANSIRIPITTPAIPTGSTLPREGDYTFPVTDLVNGDIQLTITYKPKEQPKNQAIINAITPSGTGSADNTAFWRDGGLHHILNDVPQHTALTGEITVAPGYYIRSITAYGASGNYPYTYTGNGYNGGYGTSQTGTSVPINVFVDMPDETLIVDVEFAYGIPPRDPENTLTLTVKDKDNTGKDKDGNTIPFASNWAKAEVYNDPDDFDKSVAAEQTLPTAGVLPGDVLGKNPAHGNGTLTDRKYVDTGKWVKVDFHNEVVYKPDPKDNTKQIIDTANSYYVSKVTVGPSNLGVSMVWRDDHSVSFYMPAGTAGVTVEFSKYPESGRLPDYALTVSETYRDLNATPKDMEQIDYDNNYVTHANSATIRSWNGDKAVPLHPYNMTTGENNPERVPATTQTGATGVATAGEEVTMTFIVDEEGDGTNPGWYVQSVVVISDGAAYRGTYELDTTADNTGRLKTYIAKFRMPTGDAEFIVHYRRGPKPAVPDYGFTLSLTDDDNVLTDGKYDENNIVASFVDASGINEFGHADLVVGHNKEKMTDVRHVHAGDTITLTTTLAPGYTLDYMLVNPANLQLHPVWVSYETAADGVVTAKATLTMPPEGIAVVARVVKGKPQQYTANLILHPPEGKTSMDGVGQGTFAVNGGTLANYYKSAVFSTFAVPGTTIPYDLYAFDGYYIDRVTIDPPLGVTGTLSGAFGYQDGEFVMPAANVNVNVWFKKGWPDEVKYRLKLEVFGPAYQKDATDNNYANFTQIVHTDAGGATVLAAPDSDPVYSGQSKPLREEEGVAFDRDTVYVNIHKIAGSYVDSSSINITDSGGNAISWWYAPGGIAFTMPPRSTTVRINFKQRTTELPKYTATLHLSNVGAGDDAELSTDVANATGNNPAKANDDKITELYAGDVLSLTTEPGEGRHITAAYAVEEKTGRIIDLTHIVNGQRVRSTFVPTGDEGEFAMPEDNVHVYVKFAEGKVEQDDLPLTLMVSGPAESNLPGGHGAATEVTGLTAAEHKTMEVDAPGMDTRFVKATNTVVTTFTPNEDAGYAITKLEVYDTDGKPVPYEWISVLQDPPTSDLKDETVWPGTAPEDIANHPGWKQNDKLQITFKMPAAEAPGKGGVTIHVTYGKVDKDKDYTAQIVVNDEAYNDQPTPSRNNAWFDKVLKNKLRHAQPGQWINLDLSVHPGYRIEYIKVVPQSFGIVPGLPLGPLFSQNTGFVMPEGDVTVYVKFADDGVEEYNATLVVTGAPTGDTANYATIVSPRSQPVPPATATPVYVNGAAVTVTARAGTDWVTTDYYWNTNGSAYVAKVKVTTVSGVNVPFTQQVDPATGHGRITFPMVEENVTVEVTYSTTEVKAEVYLHVIDDTADPEAPIDAANATLYYPGWTTALLGSLSPLRRDAANPWGNTAGPAGVAAGQTVNLLTNAMSGNGIYLRSAYVLYEDVGQMVNLAHIATNGDRQQESFVVHPGENHVYVTFSRTEPKENEHSAILMLKAPEDDAGRASIAAGDVYDGPNHTDQDSLDRANHGHAEVIAVQGQRVYIQVAPAEGYIIDRVLVTPLGFPLQTHGDYHYTMVGNTISFDMPHRDVAITVILKRGTNQLYDVKLHYIKDTADVNVNDFAQLAWLDGGTAMTLQADLLDSAADVWRDDQKTEIREGTQVTLTGHLAAATDPAKPDTILSAFVLRSNGTLVPLNPALEGEKAEAGGDSNYPATFTMPAADVDVYLVVTTEPPPTPWHTAVLVVTDTSPSKVNLGLNEGDLWKTSDTTAKTAITDDGSPACVWMPVAEGEKYYVRPRAHSGYAFVPPATMSCNDGAHGGNMYTESNSPYLYSDTMDKCNKAALIHFISDEALDLTVIVRDPENPSDGSVTNKLLTRQPTANPPVDDLELTSTNVGGAYQIMKGVTPGEPILLTATPANEFITATARIYYIDGTVEDIPLTKQADGTLTGSIPMPSSNATIIVTFHGDYTGTLTLVDLSASDKTAQATMSEDTGTAPDRVTVNHLGTQDHLYHLPHGTTLTANMVKNDNLANKTVYALLNRKGSTTVMTPSGQNAEGVDEYTHTINRADAEIVFVVRDKGDDKNYVASVTTVNKPAGTADPTIATSTPDQPGGAVWTVAPKDDTVTVTMDVPAGYEARLSIDNGLTLTLTGPLLTGPLNGPLTGQQATFTMPAADTRVTITYVRTSYTLTLREYAPVGTTNPTEIILDNDPTQNFYVDHDGDTATETQMTGGELVTLTQATPDATVTGMTLLSAAWTAANGESGFLGVGNTFPMPAADTVVTVRYGKRDDSPFIALVKTEGGDGLPGNLATALTNDTNTTVNGVSPYWVEGLKDDTIRVVYTIEPGYIAQVTAYKRNDTSTQYPVASVASASNGTATVTMPGSTDIVILITYSKDDGPKEGDVILQLVQHGTQEGNRANVTSPFAGTLNPATIAMDGANTPGDGITVTNWNWKDAIETPEVSYATMGDELFVYANWATNYQVVKMTVAVRRADNTETPEVPIAVSRYGAAAAGRTLMPYVNKANGEAAVVRVYYGNIFWARLHIVPHGTDGLDVKGNKTSATDSRGVNTVTSTGAKPIRREGDRLLDFMGNSKEIVQTTAIPDTTLPNNQRLVGVVWESAGKGASAAEPDDAKDAPDDKYSKNDQYNFEMPAENVDFYAVYEEESDNHSYIAKVKFADDSAHLGHAQNAVTITNQSDTAAAKGSYWTAAKKGENIVVNVKVAPGYKAEIISAKVDDQTKVPAGRVWTDDFHYYISRTQFAPNLTLGKDASFSMPADTDATVTIRFVKGYDLSLEVKDTSGKADDTATPPQVNKAVVTTNESPARTLEGVSTKPDGSGITNPTGPLKAVENGKRISTTVTNATTDVEHRVFRNSLFAGGTVRVDAPTPGAAAGDPPVLATQPYKYDMPSADVLETVVFLDEETPLLAKVEVKGEFDINGNSATPIVDYTDTSTGVNKTTTGTVWTTTTRAVEDDPAKKPHTIDMTLTVAKGYIAKIRVRRDDDDYYNNPTDETKWNWLDFEDYAFTEVTTTAADGTVKTLLPGDAQRDEVQMGYKANLIDQPSAFDANVSGDQHFRFTMAYDTADGKWKATDVTVIVEFVFAGNIPQPFDPRNVKDDDYDRKPAFLENGFIYGENRGDFAVVEIPTLIKQIADGEELFHSNNHTSVSETTVDPKNAVKFSFFLYDADADTYTPLTLGTDVLLAPYDTEDAATYTAGDPYNYYKGDNALWEGPNHWHPGGLENEVQFTGSKFKLIPTDPDKTSGKRTDGAQALYDMLNNKRLGSLEEYEEQDGDAKKTKYRTTLYVIAEDTIGQKSAYTQVWIRPHFTLDVSVISYAPNHTTTASLYPLMDQDAMDLASGYKDKDGNVVAGETQVTVDLTDPDWDKDFAHYRWNDTVKPLLTDQTSYTGEVLPANKYHQKVRVRSSELLGGFDSSYDPGAATLLKNVLPGAQTKYAMTLEKTSCLTYTRVDLDLSPALPGFDLTATLPTFPDYYKDDTLTYSVQDLVYLITGDVNGDGFTKWQDYDMVYTYVWRDYPWNNTQTEAPDPTAPGYTPQQDADWKMSTYNPESRAYRCDLNGDGVLSVQDLELVQTLFDYNRSVEDYRWRLVKDGVVEKNVLPFGFGQEKAGFNDTLFSLRADDGEPYPVERDEYWSQLVDPETTEAPPLDTPYVDEDGLLWDGLIDGPEDSGSAPSGGKPGHRDEDEFMEIPAGEEAMDWNNSFSDAVFDLPMDDPLDRLFPDDNVPGEALPETPADTTNEE